MDPMWGYSDRVIRATKERKATWKRSDEIAGFGASRRAGSLYSLAPRDVLRVRGSNRDSGNTFLPVILLSSELISPWHCM